MRLCVSSIAGPGKDNRGASATEYGLLVALVGLIALAAILLMGQASRGTFEQAAGEVSEAKSTVGEWASGTPGASGPEATTTPASLAEATHLNAIYIVDTTGAAYLDQEEVAQSVMAGGWEPYYQDIHEVGGNNDGIANFIDTAQQFILLADNHYREPGRYENLTGLNHVVITTAGNAAEVTEETDENSMFGPYQAPTAGLTGAGANFGAAIVEAEAWLDAADSDPAETWNMVFVISASPVPGSGHLAPLASLRASHAVEMRSYALFDDRLAEPQASDDVATLDVFSDGGAATRFFGFMQAVGYMEANYPSPAYDIMRSRW